MLLPVAVPPAVDARVNLLRRKFTAAVPAFNDNNN